MIQNIIFNQANFNSLPEKIKLLYKRLSAGIYALEPKEMEIDINNLPQYMTMDQYRHFDPLIGPYYRVSTYGFGPTSIRLMELKQEFKFSTKTQFAGTIFPRGSRVTEEQYWRLSPEVRVNYAKAVADGRVYYYLKAASTGAPAQLNVGKGQPQRSVVSDPVTNLKIPPVGRWREVR